MLTCGKVFALLTPMSDTLTHEFPFVEDLPKREQSRFSRFVDRWQVFKELQAAHGILVPTGLALKLADVSRQRIHQLADSGILQGVRFEGKLYITEDSLIEWLQNERQTGRPRKGTKPSFSECIDVAKELLREAREKNSSK